MSIEANLKRMVELLEVIAKNTAPCVELECCEPESIVNPPVTVETPSPPEVAAGKVPAPPVAKEVPVAPPTTMTKQELNTKLNDQLKRGLTGDQIKETMNATYNTRSINSLPVDKYQELVDILTAIPI